MLDQLRSQKKLSKGSKVLMIGKTAWQYTGELDEDGFACGIGSATRSQEEEFGDTKMDCAGGTIYGTFYKDKMHGVCSEIQGQKYRYDGEYREGLAFGKGTLQQEFFELYRYRMNKKRLVVNQSHCESGATSRKIYHYGRCNYKGLKM